MMFLTDELSAGLITLIVFLSIIIIAVIVVFARCIVVVPQAHALIVQRLGKYHSTLEAGFHVLMPIVDSKAKMVSLKETVADFKPQPVITKDNVTMQIDTVVYYQITDSKLYTYGVDNPINAIENLSATTLRNLIGDLELDQTLTSRDTINQKMRLILDEATDPWGIKVNRIELKNILPPKDIQEAMEKQMRAERQKREAILTAEGKKEAAILNAEATRIQAVKEAEGQAEAILKIAEATAEGIKRINEANPSAEYLALEGFKSLEKVADGQSTKIVVPTDIANVTGLLASLKDTIANDKKK